MQAWLQGEDDVEARAAGALVGETVLRARMWLRHQQGVKDE